MQHGVAGAHLGVWLALACALWAYFAAALRQRRGGRGWPLGRLLSFAVGVALIALAAAPAVTAWAHADLRGHMSQHLLLGMFAPLGLALGAPATLLLRSVPVATARRLSAALRHGIARRLTDPVTALALDVGSLYLLYLTPLYALTRTHPLLHGAVHVHFLAAGFLFASAMVGADPAPHRRSFRARLAILFVAIAAHSTLAKILYAYGWPRGAGHDAAQIQAGAQIMYYGGDVAELLLAVALFASWYRRAGRRAGRGVVQLRNAPVSVTFTGYRSESPGTQPEPGGAG